MYATENTGTAYGAWSSSKSILKIAQPAVTLSNKSNGMRVEWTKVPGARKVHGVHQGGVRSIVAVGYNN